MNRLIRRIKLYFNDDLLNVISLFVFRDYEKRFGVKFMREAREND